jgi:hypothetical protein
MASSRAELAASKQPPPAESDKVFWHRRKLNQVAQTSEARRPIF